MRFKNQSAAAKSLDGEALPRQHGRHLDEGCIGDRYMAAHLKTPRGTLPCAINSIANGPCTTWATGIKRLNAR